ncbi:hypothetical protein [Clostridium saccharoperbutylacetonicum]
MLNSMDVINFMETKQFFIGALISGFILLSREWLPWGNSRYDERAIYSMNVYSSIIVTMIFVSATVILGNMLFSLIEKNLYLIIFVKYKDIIFTLVILIIGRFLRKLLKSHYNINDSDELTNIIFWGGILSAGLIFIVNNIYLPSIIALLIGRLTWFDVGIVESGRQILDIKRYKISFGLTIVTILILIIIIFLHVSSDSVVKFVAGFIFGQFFIGIGNKKN